VGDQRHFTVAVSVDGVSVNARTLGLVCRVTPGAVVGVVERVSVTVVLTRAGRLRSNTRCGEPDGDTPGRGGAHLTRWQAGAVPGARHRSVRRRAVVGV